MKTMMEETNKLAARGLFASMDAAQRMDPLDEVAAPSYTMHIPGAPPLDREGMKAFGNSFYAACPGLSHNLEEVIADGDTVALRMTIRGSQTQPFVTPAGELPPSGKSFAIPAQNMIRFEDGKVVEQWSVFDMMGFMQQIGAIPS
jgi:predicted ester cyclase